MLFIYAYETSMHNQLLTVQFHEQLLCIKNPDGDNLTPKLSHKKRAV